MAAETSGIECRYYERVGESVRCLLCPQSCTIAPSRAGFCRTRLNVEAKLYLTTYGQCSSIHLDPIEKKPLFHFYPGSQILSLGSLGCNLACRFCQNWQISQSSSPTRYVSPEEAAQRASSVPGNVGVAYTYNEPLVWYEYLLDAASAVRKAGLKNVLVTNGEINEGPLRELLALIDAMNIDVKSMDEEFYRSLSSGKLAPVLRTVEIAHESGCHVEITNLLIPGSNDRPDQIQRLIDWVAELDPRIPLHFSRYHPEYKMTAPPTPAEKLMNARSAALQKLKYVYVGNIHIAGAADTNCPTCGKPVIERTGYSIAASHLDGRKCAYCSGHVDIIS
ncbi:MAG TPA: AmmeMemoRadiSam system radical SAM enzyme [Armatimonadota bacterium]|nr:AmmeMemoRadiSam system radical SAM enzyme [Armatimonadota bacterium]